MGLSSKDYELKMQFTLASKRKTKIGEEKVFDPTPQVGDKKGR